MLKFLVTLFIGLHTWAYNVPSLAGPVMDQVGVISRSSQQVLSEDLFQFKAKTGVQIQVFIASNLNDEPIESVAIQIFDQWKLGDAKKDNGILFIVAPNERRLRIEVGQGLEGSVPDVIAKRIIEDVVKPSFQKGQFEQGILSGVAAIQNYVVTGEAPEAIQPEKKLQIPIQYLGFGFIILFIIIFLFSPSLAIHMLLAILSGGRSGGGSGGGGSWSGGGGRSSGGGASGSW